MVILMLAVACLVLIILSVYVCGVIARDKDCSGQYAWFGLLTVVGIIVVALMPRGKSAAARLLELQQLLDAQLITADEFEKRRNKLSAP